MATVVTAMAHPACSTNAVGIEDCRRIEYARCDAASHCPSQFEIRDTEECRVFYRDHCLHGLPAAASANDVKACVGAIEQLSACARDSGAKTPVAACGVSASNPKLATVCALLAQPEAMDACDFLGGAPSSGGQAGIGGQAATTVPAAGGASSVESASGGAPGTDLGLAGIGGLADLLGIGGLPL